MRACPSLLAPLSAPSPWSGLDFEPYSHSLLLSVPNYLRWCSGESFSSAENEVASSEKICTQIEKRGVLSEEMKNRAWEWIHGCIYLEVREQPGEPAHLPFVVSCGNNQQGLLTVLVL